jgi:MATE family multidrug resistance protein
MCEATNRGVAWARSRSARVAWREFRLMSEITFTTIVIELGTFTPSVLAASYIGRSFGPVYLDGFQLANLTVNLFSLSLLQGLYSASDTLSPQAIGVGNYKEVGLLAMRGFVGSILILVPICVILIFYMRDMLVWVGIDAEVASLASDWYRIYVVSLIVVYHTAWGY